MSAAPSISAIAPWFGGKRTLAPRIVAELGEHRCYWEPFCGSMAVMLAKPKCPMETVNDLHGDLINLARCIQHRAAGPTLYRRLRRTLTVEGLHDEAALRFRERGHSPSPLEPDIDRSGWPSRRRGVQAVATASTRSTTASRASSAARTIPTTFACSACGVTATRPRSSSAPSKALARRPSHDPKHARKSLRTVAEFVQSPASRRGRRWIVRDDRPRFRCPRSTVAWRLQVADGERWNCNAQLGAVAVRRMRRDRPLRPRGMLGVRRRGPGRVPR